MIKQEEIVIPAQPERTKMVEGDTCCDICGGVIKFENEFNHAVVAHAVGYQGARHGDRTRSEFDLCGNCYICHVKPLMERLTKSGPRVTEDVWPG